ncbi:MAG: hypothetical protein EBS01_10115 [Verrucomicrobia bacterium]|nr:hypothetical protein [Verrucomicrobiota bacterium]
MKATFHKLLILCCALYLSGAHWTILQTTAWTGMIISRSLNSSVSEAIESTFDGKHPCNLCSAIADGRHSEERSQKDLELLKKLGDFQYPAWLSTEIQPRFDSSAVLWPLFSPQAATRNTAPPTPPPLA